MRPVCYLFGAGERFGSPPPPRPIDFVIAVDGGFSYAKDLGLVPDLLVGDFDSLCAPLPDSSKTLTLPQQKDDTDMVAALREGWKQGFRVFHIYGGAGGRLDHTLANIQCLAALSKRGGRGYLHDCDAIVTAISNGAVAFPASAKGTVSVLCHSSIATGVFETGLKYSLTNKMLRNSYPLGVSNEFVGLPSRISVASGTLLIRYASDIQEEKP